MNLKNTITIMSENSKKFGIIFLSALLVALCLNILLFVLFSSNPLEEKNVVIDPGHGGIDPGTNDTVSFFEKDINLQISKKLSTDLQSFKCFTDVTRNDDVSLDGLISSESSRHKKDLMARVKKFNSGVYDIFVSIHVNRSSNKNAIGPMVLFSSKKFENRFLAECIQNRLNEHARKYAGRSFARKPVKSSFYILNNANIPGVIVETGFISNAAEKNMLINEAYQEKLSKAICLGIRDYFKDIDIAILRNNSGEENNEEEDLPFNFTHEIRFVENEY